MIFEAFLGVKVWIGREGGGFRKQIISLAHSGAGAAAKRTLGAG
jgi:hypothetical protein